MNLTQPYYDHAGITIYHGDCREVLQQFADDSVHCCVTSPPYWGLRDYGTAEWEGGDEICEHTGVRRPGNGDKSFTNGGTSRDKPTNTCRKCGATRIDSQLGLERTPEEYISRVVEVFREVRRVLRDDATCWVNMGDSYAHGIPGGGCVFANGRDDGRPSHESDKARGRVKVSTVAPGFKVKDLCGIPWMLAFALRADGWYLRSDIIWHKPNPMPESVTDRPTKSHEYLFLLSKSERYFYDADAIKETNSNPNGRNKRTVWTIATQPTPDAHFATFPEDLIRPCILAGCPAGGTVLDPFFGSGTTGVVAQANNCKTIGIEINPEYIEIAKRRLAQDVLFRYPEYDVPKAGAP